MVSCCSYHKDAVLCAIIITMVNDTLVVVVTTSDGHTTTMDEGHAEQLKPLNRTADSVCACVSIENDWINSRGDADQFAGEDVVGLSSSSSSSSS